MADDGPKFIEAALSCNGISTPLVVLLDWITDVSVNTLDPSIRKSVLGIERAVVVSGLEQIIVGILDDVAKVGIMFGDLVGTISNDISLSLNCSLRRSRIIIRGDPTAKCCRAFS